jgi:hypothetical protein
MNTALNIKVVDSALAQLSKVLVDGSPDQDYAQTDNSRWAMQVLINKGISSPLHYQQLLAYREKHDKQIKKRYRVSLPSGVGAFMFDYEAVMKKRKVPQVTRVKIGLLDTLIFLVAQKVGAVEFKEVV